MADIKVEIPGLENFKNTVNKSGRQFDEIKANLRTHLQNLRSNDWVTEGAEDFDVVFRESEKDIETLVGTMERFSTYLQRKIEQAMSINQHRMSSM